METVGATNLNPVEHHTLVGQRQSGTQKNHGSRKKSCLQNKCMRFLSEPVCTGSFSLCSQVTASVMDVATCSFSSIACKCSESKNAEKAHEEVVISLGASSHPATCWGSLFSVVSWSHSIDSRSIKIIIGFNDQFSQHHILFNLFFTLILSLTAFCVRTHV